jgi:hypothetical protein
LRYPLVDFLASSSGDPGHQQRRRLQLDFGNIFRQRFGEKKWAILTQIGAICSANNGQRKKIDFD